MRGAPSDICDPPAPGLPATPASPDARSLVDVLRRHADARGTERAISFLAGCGKDAASLDYADLDRRARAIAAALQRWRAGGERALLLYPPGLDFVTAFCGCLYAGVVAVPAYPPHPARPERCLARLGGIVRDCEPAVILTTGVLLAAAPAIARAEPALGAARWLATDAMPRTEDGAGWRDPGLAGAALALLQYTSGSTAAPKGVMVTHANLLANIAAIHAAEGNAPDSVSLSWLPVYHDMGLVEGLLAPLHGGYPAWLLPPAAFLRRPLAWLEAIARVRATNSGAPNFAYDLCVRRTSAEERARLDLSSWRIAYSGAEPVRAATLRAFADAFAPSGFRWTSLRPVYGLAEATLLVAADARGEAPAIRDVDARSLAGDRVVEAGAGAERAAAAIVACGRPALGTRVAVVDPATSARAAPGAVGEIWVSGPGVAAGYWGRPEASEEVFRARLEGEEGLDWLRTGDLGFVDAERVFVTGRLKDVLIVRGRKHYPHDLERSVEGAHPAVRAGCSAAFSLPAGEGEGDGEGEGLAVVAEVDVPRRGGDAAAAAAAAEATARDILRAIRERIALDHELQLQRIVLLAPGGVPKTTSGKLRRGACRRALVEGTLPVVGRWVDGGDAVRGAA